MGSSASRNELNETLERDRDDPTPSTNEILITGNQGDPRPSTIPNNVIKKIKIKKTSTRKATAKLNRAGTETPFLTANNPDRSPSYAKQPSSGLAKQAPLDPRGSFMVNI